MPCFLFVIRKLACQEFGVKLTQTIFSSDFSSRNAENMGFKTDREIRLEWELVKNDSPVSPSKTCAI